MGIMQPGKEASLKPPVQNKHLIQSNADSWLVWLAVKPILPRKCLRNRPPTLIMLTYPSDHRAGKRQLKTRNTVNVPALLVSV